MPKTIQAKAKIRTARQTTILTQPEEERINTADVNGSIFDFLKFGESYTSLILGIIVVVIATVLLLSFVRNKSISARTTAVKQQTIAAKTVIKDTKIVQNPVKTEQKNNTKTQLITNTKAATQTKPVAQVKPKQQIAQKQVQKQIAVNTVKTAKSNNTVKGSVYMVVQGDTLWNIAEVKYGSGYNWTDIVKANNISNPDLLYAGTKITLPDVQAKIATVAKADNSNTAQTNTAVQTGKISGTNYTIVKGDNLWTIAERAYGNGYKWMDLAKSNHLDSNPGLIHSGNSIQIPRS